MSSHILHKNIFMIFTSISTPMWMKVKHDNSVWIVSPGGSCPGPGIRNAETYKNVLFSVWEVKIE